MADLSKINRNLKQQLQQCDESITTLLAKQNDQVQKLVSMKQLVKDIHKSEVRNKTLESLKKMEEITESENNNPKPMVYSLVGNAGIGKSHFLNDLIKEQLFPSTSGSTHVTKVLLHLAYDEQYSMEPVLCTHIEIDDRCKETNFNVNAKSTTISIDIKRKVFSRLDLLTNTIQDIQQQLQEADIYRIKVIKIGAPIKTLKDLGIELIDGPGLNSGEFSQIFKRLAVEAGKLADRIVLFPNSFRCEFPTDVFELVGKIFNDPEVQRNPKTFSFVYGGKYIDPSFANKEFLDCFSESVQSNIETAHQRHLSDFFDYKFDDIPRGRNEKPVNDQIVFVENKSYVLEMLKKEFCLFPIPYYNKTNKKYQEEFQTTKLNFELMVKKDRLIHLHRLSQQLKENALICIPILISKSKHQTPKYLERYIKKLMKKCFKTMKRGVAKLESIHQFFGFITMRCVESIFPEQFLESHVDVKKCKGEKNYELIVSHLQLMEGHIHTVARNHFKFEQNFQNFSDTVLPLFDMEHEDHIILATEMKGYLNEWFEDLIETRNCHHLDQKFDIKFCDVKRDETNTSALRVPTLDNYDDVKSMVSAKIVSNSDGVSKKKLYRRDESKAEIITVEEINFLPIDSSIIGMHFTKSLKILVQNSTKGQFEAFKDMIPSSTLLNHTQRTRVAPIFFLSMDGNISPLAFNRCWKQYSTESLIFIVTPQERADDFRDQVQQFNAPSHHVRILSVSTENSLCSPGVLMNAVFQCASLFEFPIVHMIKENIISLYEYISPLKEYITNEWTPIRYLRSAESIIYNESNSMSEDEKKEIKNKYLVSATRKAMDFDGYDKLLLQGTESLNNDENFIVFLRAVDSECNERNSTTPSNLEHDFKSEFFAKHKGRFVCWDGTARSIDKNKIYSRDGFNYIVSNYTTGIETYFIPAMKGIVPVPDDKFTQDSLPDNYENSLEHGFDPKNVSFRTNMLSHGVGSFLHFGFKYESKKLRSTSNKKRKNSDRSNNSKRKKRK